MSLYNAIHQNRIDDVRRMLEDPDVDVHSTYDDSEGRTPFMVACFLEDPEMVRLFFDNKREIDFNQKDLNGWTAWYHAGDAVQEMLAKDNRIDIAIPGKYGMNCFHFSFYRYYPVDCVEMLLATGRPEIPRLLKARDDDGHTPIGLAYKNDEWRVANLISAYNWDPVTTQRQLRIKLGYPEYAAAELFATIVLLCDDYYEIKNQPRPEPSNLGSLWSTCSIL